MHDDFYPTDPASEQPEPTLRLEEFLLIVSILIVLTIICLLGAWVFSWVMAPVLSTPAGACVAPLCALIFKPRFVSKVIDTHGNRVHTAYPHHEVPVKPDPLTLDDKVLYETTGSTWRGNMNQRTFIVYAFKDINGNWVHCGNLDG